MTHSDAQKHRSAYNNSTPVHACKGTKKLHRGTKGTVLFVPLFPRELLGIITGAQKEPSPLCPFISW
jgi:hypothetical protein